MMARMDAARGRQIHKSDHQIETQIERPGRRMSRLARDSIEGDRERQRHDDDGAGDRHCVARGKKDCGDAPVRYGALAWINVVSGERYFSRAAFLSDLTTDSKPGSCGLSVVTVMPLLAIALSCP